MSVFAPPDFPIVCQVDQDVVLQPGWMQHGSSDDLADERVGTAQGTSLPIAARSLFAARDGL